MSQRRIPSNTFLMAIVHSSPFQTMRVFVMGFSVKESIPEADFRAISTNVRIWCCNNEKFHDVIEGDK